jgi:hypothetical protein
VREDGLDVEAHGMEAMPVRRAPEGATNRAGDRFTSGQLHESDKDPGAARKSDEAERKNAARISERRLRVLPVVLRQRIAKAIRSSTGKFELRSVATAT